MKWKVLDFSCFPEAKVLSRKEDLAQQGQRPVQLLAHKNLLKDFLFHPDRSFDSVVKASFSSSINANRNEAVLNIPAADSVHSIVAPSGATHYRFIFAISFCLNMYL